MIDDETAVTRFEVMVRYQAPAPQWTPVTPFDFESRKVIEGKHPELIRDVLQPKDVLDVGCGPDAILVRLLREGLCVDAIGVDPQLRDEVSEYGYRKDLEQAVNHDMSADVVICREMLEHLTVLELVQAVRQLVSLSRRLIYVTTRFAQQPDHLLAVGTEFDVDPTHITCLTKPFLRALFVLEGCKSRPDLEAQMDWQGKGRCLVFEV